MQMKEVYIYCYSDSDDIENVDFIPFPTDNIEDRLLRYFQKAYKTILDEDETYINEINSIVNNLLEDGFYDEGRFIHYLKKKEIEY